MSTIALHTYLGQINQLLEESQVSEAAAHCRHILQHFPRHVVTYRSLAQALLEQGEFAGATDLFQRVLSADPNDFVSHLGLAIIHEEQSSFSQAIWHMERAFEMKPYDAIVQKKLRQLLAQNNTRPPDRLPLTTGALARMYLRGELFQLAVQELRNSLRQDEDRVDLEVLLAEALWWDGQRVEAVEVCRRILGDLPNCLQANAILAEIWIHAGNAREAQSHLQRIQDLTQLDRAHVDIESMVGRALTADGTRILPDLVEIEYLEDAALNSRLMGEAADWSEAERAEPGKGLESDGMFGWLREDMFEEPEPAEIDESRAALEPQIPGVESMWLMDGEAPAEELGAAEAESDWLRDLEEGEDLLTLLDAEPRTGSDETDELEEFPHWLDETTDSDFEPVQADPSMVESDWLRADSSWEELDEDEKVMPAETDWLVDALGRADSEPPTQDDISDLVMADLPSVGTGEFTPDWMFDEEEPLDDTAADSGQLLELPADEFVKAPEDASDEEAAEEGTPEWLMSGELGYAEEDLGPLSDAEPDRELLAELSDDSGIEQGEIPDWLAEGAADDTEEVAELTSEGLAQHEESLPDWLQGEHFDTQAGIDIVERAVESLGISPELVYGADEQLPDWLQEGQQQSAEAEDDLAQGTDETPSAGEDLEAWLSTEAAGTGDEAEPGLVDDLEVMGTLEDDIPDWIREEGSTAEITAEEPLSAGEVEFTSEELEPDEEEVPSWLKLGHFDTQAGIDVVESAMDSLGLSTTVLSQGEPDLPDWLREGEPVSTEKEDLDTSPPVELPRIDTGELTPDEEDIPSWFEDERFSTQAGIDVVERAMDSLGLSTDILAGDEPDLPDWLREEAPGTDAESDRHEEVEVPSEGLTPDDEDLPSWLARDHFDTQAGIDVVESAMDSLGLSTELLAQGEPDLPDWLAEEAPVERDALEDMDEDESEELRADEWGLSADELQGLPDEIEGLDELPGAIAQEDIPALEGALGGLTPAETVDYDSTQLLSELDWLADEDEMEPAEPVEVPTGAFEEMEEVLEEELDEEPDDSIAWLEAFESGEVEIPVEIGQEAEEAESREEEASFPEASLEEEPAEPIEQTALGYEDEVEEVLDEEEGMDWLEQLGAEPPSGVDELLALEEAEPDLGVTLGLAELESDADFLEESLELPEEEETRDWLEEMAAVSPADDELPPSVLESEGQETIVDELFGEDQVALEPSEGLLSAELLVDAEEAIEPADLEVEASEPLLEEELFDQEGEEDGLAWLEEMASEPGAQPDEETLVKEEDKDTEPEEDLPVYAGEEEPLEWLEDLEDEEESLEVPADTQETADLGILVEDEAAFELEEESITVALEEEPEEPPEDLEDAMAWLEELAAKQGALPEELPAIGVLSGTQRPTETPVTAELEEETSMLAAEGEEEPPEVPEDLDDAMAWLEELAAKQGAPTEELPTVADVTDLESDAEQEIEPEEAAELEPEVTIEPLATDVAAMAEEAAEIDRELDEASALLEELAPAEEPLLMEEPPDAGVEIEPPLVEEARDPLDEALDWLEHRLSAEGVLLGEMPEPEEIVVPEEELAEALDWLERYALGEVSTPATEPPAEGLEALEALLADEFPVEDETFEDIDAILEEEVPSGLLEELDLEADALVVEVDEELADIVSDEVPPEAEDVSSLEVVEEKPATGAELKIKPTFGADDDALFTPSVDLTEGILEDGFLDDVPEDPEAALAWLAQFVDTDQDLSVEEVSEVEEVAVEEPGELAAEMLGAEELPEAQAIAEILEDEAEEDAELLETIPEDPDAAVAWLEQMVDESLEEQGESFVAPEAGEISADASDQLVVDETGYADTEADFEDDLLAGIPEDPDDAMAWLEKLAEEQEVLLGEERLETAGTDTADQDTDLDELLAEYVDGDEAKILSEWQELPDTDELRATVDDLSLEADDTRLEADVAEALPDWFTTEPDAEEFPGETDWLTSLPEPDVAGWLEAEDQATASGVYDFDSEVTRAETRFGTGPLREGESGQEAESEVEEPLTLPDTDRLMSSAVELDESLLTLARQTLDVGDYDEAISTYQELLDAGEGLSTLIADLETAADEHSAEPLLRRLLGDAYMRNGQLQRALDNYRIALDRL